MIRCNVLEISDGATILEALIREGYIHTFYKDGRTYIFIPEEPMLLDDPTMSDFVENLPSDLGALGNGQPKKEKKEAKKRKKSPFLYFFQKYKNRLEATFQKPNVADAKKPIGDKDFDNRRYEQDPGSVWNSNNPLSKPKPLTVHCPEKIKPYIDFWNNANGVRSHKDPTTKIFRESIRSLKTLIDGAFYFEQRTPHVPEKWFNQIPTFTQFCLSVDRFSRSITDLSLFPKNKAPMKKFSLVDFLYNPNLPFENKSLFLHHIENMPRKIVFSKELSPAFTKELIRVYKSVFPGTVLTPDHVKEITRLANAVHQVFIDRGKEQLVKLSFKQRAVIVIDLVSDFNTESPIHEANKPWNQEQIINRMSAKVFKPKLNLGPMREV